jgi:putative peptide zinc metalloprotease protein
MTKTLFSPSWYRVAQLRPALRKQAVIHRHSYRGEPWHVIEERATEQFYRFTPATYFILALMDGTRAVDAIWRAALDRLGDNAPSQGEMIDLLAKLHFADLLKTDATPEAQQLFQLARGRERRRWLGRIASPFAMKVSLFDPDDLLDHLAPVARLIFSWPGLVLWLVCVGAGVALAAVNWGAIVDRLDERVLDPWNLAGLLIAYPFIKLFHETGHALAVKRWGGRVSDVGVMFILLMPVPYVDASASSSFQSKWRRATVDAAGILAELLIAALALMLWLQTDQPALRGVLFNLMLIGTVSTLLFNGNPLVKFDGYYILSDLLEIPNLAQRSQRYLYYLVKRHVWGVAGAVSPVTARGEAFWLAVYGPCSVAYRIFIVFSTAWFVAGEYAAIGLLLSFWCLVALGVVPLARMFRSLVADPDLRERRGRLIGSVAAAGGLVGAALFLLPAPFATVAEAVAVAPEKRQVRAAAEGFLIRLIAAPGADVPPGAALAEMVDPTVDAEVKVLTAQVGALDARLRAVEFARPAEANVIRAEMKSAQEELARMSERRAEQTVAASAAGQFLVADAGDQPGRFLQRGALIGYVHDPGDVIIRSVVDQAGMGAIGRGVKDVAIWQAGNATSPRAGSIQRIAPGGGAELPSKALAAEGGGSFSLDPRWPEKLRARVNLFQIDLTLAAGAPAAFIGQRYFVRFTHEPRPLGLQLFDLARQSMLQRFGV